MGFEELLAAIRDPKTIEDHPDWPAFKARKLPDFISFYYTSRDGQEAFWDHARIIKLDPNKLLLTLEGTHGTPLKFEITRMQHCKNAQTGEKVQPLFFDLIRMWQDIYEPSSAE